MSDKPKIYKFKDLSKLTERLRSDLIDFDVVLLYAYNCTGKTRLSMAFKDAGKRKKGIDRDTLYYNAFTEDLFTWENDLENDASRHLKLNQDSTFFDGLKDLALDGTIASYLSRYTDFEFDIDYVAWTVSFRKDGQDHIKISRGEETIFIWSLFMAICERVVDGHDAYRWVKYIYVDDPISSLDDNNAIAVACDLAALLRKAAGRETDNGDADPIKVVFSSHHALFFNVMCNELGRPKRAQKKAKCKRYFLHRPGGSDTYTLRHTEATPFFHHVASLAELQQAAESGELYTHHFNALRSIMEKTASFFGHDDLRFCLRGLDDDELFNRALNLLSHGAYSLFDPVEMMDDNKQLFRNILQQYLNRFEFSLPESHP